MMEGSDGRTSPVEPGSVKSRGEAEWLPIETVPRETLVLLQNELGETGLGAIRIYRPFGEEPYEVLKAAWAYREDGHYQLYIPMGARAEAVAWMPLPSRPRAPQEPGDKAPEAK
jgi:hypothetical protein